MQRFPRPLILALLASLPLISTGAARRTANATTVSARQILAIADAIAQADLPALNAKSADKGSVGWNRAVMCLGYAELSHRSAHGPEYVRALQSLAAAHEWAPILQPKHPFHPDDFCFCQTLLELCASDRNPAHLAPTKERLDALAEHLLTPTVKPALTFGWCDTLFMAPPALARMSDVTRDRRYLDAMDAEFWRCTAALYDRDEHLFYRDARFVNKPDAHGHKVFWSRGNGWVLGGIALVLDRMPTDYPSRPKYEALLREMSAKLATLQQPDGTWATNLLDPHAFAGAETSGTSLMTYAMAWGIHHNVLDRETFLPLVSKAWAGLLAARRADGLPGYAQSENFEPGYVKADGTQPYAVGGYLLAACELQALAPLTLPQVTLIPPAPAPSTRPAATAATRPAPPVPQPAAGALCFARYVPERMDDIAWENDRIAHRIYGPALQHNPKEHSSSGIDVWVKSVRYPVINEWYQSRKYHLNRGTGLDFYEVGLSRGDGGLGIWDGGKLFCSADWVDHKILDLGPNQCGFTISYAPWEANGRKVWERRTMTLRAGSNLTRIESSLDSDAPGDLTVAIGLAKRDGEGGKLLEDKSAGVMSYWQPPERDGTIGVGVLVDPAMFVGFEQDALNYLLLIRVTPGKPFVYYSGACWDKGLDFHSAEEWETYLRKFKKE
jgi:rhamnogalacturonyl hydrolase YesR